MMRINKICPYCNNPNYIISLEGISKSFEYKCINCNSYLNDEDFLTVQTKTMKQNDNTIDIGETIREMIAYFEGCYKNAGEDTKAQERFGRYLLVLNLMLEERDGANE